jgi:hypothetical protein
MDLNKCSHDLNRIISIVTDWDQDEKLLIDVAIILHELRSQIHTSQIYYFYTSESRKSARYKLMDLKTKKMFDLRVDLLSHTCKLLRNGRNVYETFDSITEFTEYYNENIVSLIELIGSSK